MLDASLLLPEKPRPLRRAEYERLVALGAFEDERIELIRGVLVDMSPDNPDHVSPIDRLNMILTPALVGKGIVRVQSPIVARDDSVPEPDIAVVPAGDYRREHPCTAFLVIEVAVSSLSKDQDPRSDGYGRVAVKVEGEIVHPQAFPEVSVAVAEVFR